MSEPEGKLFDHDYDGIQELDNRLPPWWLNLFYLSILFAVVYMMYYHVLGIGDLQNAEYQKEINPTWSASADDTYKPLLLFGAYHPPLHDPARDITPRMIAEGAGLPIFQAAPVEKDTLSYAFASLTDAASLAEGKSIYLKNCVACHGVFGEGGIGPNLTDAYWIHGDGGINGIVKLVRNGVPVKGMIAWKTQLSTEQILQVSSYLETMQGSEPANGKAPEGQRVSTD